MGWPIPPRPPKPCDDCCPAMPKSVWLKAVFYYQLRFSGELAGSNCYYAGWLPDLIYAGSFFFWVTFCIDAMGNSHGGWTGEPPDWTPKFFGWGNHCCSFEWHRGEPEMAIITVSV